MNNTATRALFALVESFFTEYLRRQRGASEHTVRAYRDALKLLFEFVAQRRGRGIAALELNDLDAETIGHFLDHLETARSNSAATRNCRRAAIRSFFRHLVRNDLAHAQQYTQVLAIPAKKSRHRPAAYLEAHAARPTDGATTRCCYSSTTAAHGSARPSAFAGRICNWRRRGRCACWARGRRSGYSPCGGRPPMRCTACAT